MKAVIISRVSTEEQKDGSSLAAQEQRLRDYCKRKGMEIIKVFSFDESAYKSTRIEFDEILSYIESSKEKLAICFDKVDRLSRNIFDKRVHLLYEKAVNDEIEIHFSSESQVLNSSISATEKFQFGISLGLAKYYSDAISDNVKRSFNQMLNEGKWIGKAPVGYLSTKTNGESDFILDPVRAPLIKKMFELYSTGNYSVKTLQEEMIKLGMSSTEGYNLCNSMIYKILRDKFYMGIMTSKGKEYPHKYPCIISRSLYYKVQEVRKSFNKKKIKYAAKPFVFRGLITCAKCGATITGETAKKKYIYYSCYNPRKTCERIYIPEKVLLDEVEKTLKSLQPPKEKMDEIVEGLNIGVKEANKFRQETISRLEKDLKLTQLRLDKALDAWLDGKLTDEHYKVRKEKGETQMAEIEGRLEEYLSTSQLDIVTAQRVLEISNRAFEIFQSSDIKEKRQLLNMIYQNCRLSGKNPLFELRTPFDAIAECAYQPTMLRR